MGSAQQSETKSQGSSSPWGPQAAALTSAFGDAQNAYAKASTATAPSNFTAGMTPDQLSTFKQMLGYAGNNGVPGAEASAGTNLLGAGSTAATGALSRLGAFDPTATNNMGTVTDAAKSYASGLDIPGAVRAAMQPAVETARDVTLPGLDSAAATSGNVNSSRTALSEGIVQRGLAEQAGNLASTMQNSAYETGANIGANQSNNNTNMLLQALQGAGSMGTAAATGGATIGSNSIGDQGNLFNLANTGGAGQQTANQLDLTNELQKYQSATSSPYDALNGLMNIIGTNNWGSNSSGTSNTSTTPSAWSVVGGLLSGIGGLGRLSDRRAKADITQVGELFDGTPVYRYRYKGQPGFQIGLMADEVEQSTPEAVAQIEGFKVVNYKLATDHLV